MPLVDDHPLFRKGLRLLLEDEGDLKVVGEAGDGQAGIELAQELSPDVIDDGHQHARPGWHRSDPTNPGEAPKSKIIALSIHSKRICPGDAAGRGRRIYLEAKRARRSGGWYPGGEERVEGILERLHHGGCDRGVPARVFPGFHP